MCDVCYVCRGERALFAGGTRVMRYVLEAKESLCHMLELCVLRTVSAGSCVLRVGNREGCVEYAVGTVLFCVLLCMLGTVWRVSTAGHPVLGHAERDVYKHEV